MLICDSDYIFSLRLQLTIKNPVLRFDINSFCGPEFVAEALIILEKENKICLVLHNNLLNGASPKSVGDCTQDCFEEGMQNSLQINSERFPWNLPDAGILSYHRKLPVSSLFWTHYSHNDMKKSFSEQVPAYLIPASGIFSWVTIFHYMWQSGKESREEE